MLKYEAVTTTITCQLSLAVLSVVLSHLLHWLRCLSYWFVVVIVHQHHRRCSNNSKAIESRWINPQWLRCSLVQHATTISKIIFRRRTIQTFTSNSSTQLNNTLNSPTFTDLQFHSEKRHNATITAADSNKYKSTTPSRSSSSSSYSNPPPPLSSSYDFAPSPNDYSRPPAPELIYNNPSYAQQQQQQQHYMKPPAPPTSNKYRY